jgi:hypothetical protein
LFAFDMKDGYWHCDLHSDMWEYMCTTSPATGVILFGIYFYFQSQSGA